MHQLSTSWIPVENSLSAGVDPCINFQPVGYRLKTAFQQALQYQNVDPSKSKAQADYHAQRIRLSRPNGYHHHNPVNIFV
jgi:hypothetical protein